MSAAGMMLVGFFRRMAAMEFRALAKVPAAADAKTHDLSLRLRMGAFRARGRIRGAPLASESFERMAAFHANIVE